MTFCAAAQTSKSTVMENAIGQRLDDSPKPCLLVVPTEQQAQRRTGPRIQAYIRATPSLWERATKGKTFSATRMTIAGAPLRLAWGGSVSQLASDSVADVYIDEIDQMAGSVNAQGGIIEQAEVRTAAHEDGIVVAVCTPTEGNIEAEELETTGIAHWKVVPEEQCPSMIWRLWQSGTRHEYAVPCPTCLDWFVPRSDLLVYPKDGTALDIRNKAALACPHCGEAHLENLRPHFRENGVYIAPGQRPKLWAHGNTHAIIDDTTTGESHTVELGDWRAGGATPHADPSFWVSGLLNWNRKRTFGYVAVRLERAKRSGDPAKLRGVKNLFLGECVWFGGDAPTIEAASTKKAAYSLGDVPEWSQALFLTVDVQGDRLVWVCRAHGPNEASALVDHGELFGSTRKEDVWRDLRDLAATRYQGHRIKRVAIDSGYLPEQVYTWCIDYGSEALATKGQASHLARKEVRASDITVTDQRGRKRNLQLWMLDVDRLKLWVHTRIESSGDPVWSLPADVGDDYLEQVVAEERRREGERIRWKVLGANHYLDCEALQRFLAVRFKRALNRIEREPAAEPVQSDNKQRAIFRRRANKTRGAW